MKLIELDALVAEIERKIMQYEIAFNNPSFASDEASLIAKGKYRKLLDIRQFINTLEVKEVQEEPVSEDLEVASKEWLRPQLDKSYANYGEVKMMELTHFDGYAMLDAIEFGAEWQKKQDQSTIELAEDHAMLAGMNKMEEQMMAKAIDAKLLEGHLIRQKGVTHPLHVGDKVKVIVIMED